MAAMLGSYCRHIGGENRLFNEINRTQGPVYIRRKDAGLKAQLRPGIVCATQ